MRIGGFTIESLRREAEMRSWEFQRMKKSVEDKLEERVNKTRNKFVLNTVHCIECCKTCKHKHLFGAHGNMNGSGERFNGCMELGIRINDNWYCSKWQCSEEYSPYKLEGPDPDIVAEILYLEKQEK